MNLAGLTDLIEAKNQLKRTHEKLANYERELITKDQSIKAQEKDLKLILHAFNEERNRFEVEKQELSKRVADADILSYDLEGREQRLRKDIEAFKAEKAVFFKENQEIIALKSKIEKTWHETEKIHATNLLQNSQLVESMEKIEQERALQVQEREKLEADKLEFAKSKEKLQLGEKNLQLDREALQHDRHEFEERLGLFRSERKKMQNELETCEKLKKKVEIQKLEMNLMRERSLSGEDSKLRDLLEDLQEAMDLYNEEVTVKEMRLAQEQAELKKESQKIMSSVVHINQMQEFLKQAKHEIYVFYTEIVPELELMSTKCKSLEESLRPAFGKIEALYVRMVESALRVGNAKDSEVTFINFHEKNTESNKRAQGEYLFDYKNVDGLTKELLTRVKGVCLKERDLEKQSREQKNFAEILNKAKDSLATARNDLDAEREKINEQSMQIEQAIKALHSKECEVRLLKQELDKRTALLRNKENQLEVRMFQIREFQASVS